MPASKHIARHGSKPDPARANSAQWQCYRMAANITSMCGLLNRSLTTALLGALVGCQSSTLGQYSGSNVPPEAVTTLPANPDPFIAPEAGLDGSVANTHAPGPSWVGGVALSITAASYFSCAIRTRNGSVPQRHQENPPTLGVADTITGQTASLSADCATVPVLSQLWGKIHCELANICPELPQRLCWHG